MSRARKTPAIWQDTAPTPPEKRVLVAKPVAGFEQQTLALQDPEPKSRPTAATSTPRKLWFCVYLPYLPLESFEARDGARAIVEDQHGIHRILLADEPAMKAGVMPGQSTNAALALVPELHLDERSPIREQQVLESVATWLEQFSSFVSIAAADLLLFEVAGSMRLFGGLLSLRRQVVAGLREQGFNASLAIAPTPLGATWLSRAGHRACIREPANLAAALRPLPLSCLDWPATLHEVLSGMGVSTVGECMRLPRAGFAKRFGPARLLELDRALGRLPDPRNSWRAPERFCADYEMTEEQSDRELLLAICRELMLSHERFLLGRQLGTQRVLFSFFHLKAPATQLPLGCANAERSTTHWFDLLRIRFEQLRLPEAVIAVRLQGGLTQALRTGSGHLDFRDGTQRAQRYPVAQLAERLVARVGNESVHGVYTVAEHRPQYAWSSRKLLSEKAVDGFAALGAGLKRPLWMLPEPALLPVEEGCPLHQGRLRFVEGPERLETGWWDADGIARDYYTAINPHGIHLWVFRNRCRTADWFLHGIFG